MCDRYEGKKHMYIDEKTLMRKMLPDYDWEAQTLCESCAKRETGNKQWRKIKRGNSNV